MTEYQDRSPVSRGTPGKIPGVPGRTREQLKTPGVPGRAPARRKSRLAASHAHNRSQVAGRFSTSRKHARTDGTSESGCAKEIFGGSWLRNQYTHVIPFSRRPARTPARRPKALGFRIRQRYTLPPATRKWPISKSFHFQSGWRWLETLSQGASLLFLFLEVSSRTKSVYGVHTLYVRMIVYVFGIGNFWKSGFFS